MRTEGYASIGVSPSCLYSSMIRKMPAPDLIRGGIRFSDKDHAPLKAERDLEAAGIHHRRLMTGSGFASCASYWQNSGAAAPRERVRMFAPLPAARGEVEGAKRPTVRGPLRDSERSGSRNGGADSGREVKAQPRGSLIPTFSPHAGRRRPVAMKTSARVRACVPFTRAVKPLTMESVGERRA